MLDPIQVLLTVVVTILTGLLVIIGVEVFRLLNEAKRVLERANKILDDVERIAGTFGKPLEGMTSLLSGVKQGVAVVKVLARMFHDEEKDSEEDEL